MVGSVRCPYPRHGIVSIHRESEKAHSRKPTVARPATNIPFIALRAVSPRAPAAFCRDIVTPAARICHEELQVVAAELPENLSCVALQGLCRPLHYIGRFPPNTILG